MIILFGIPNCDKIKKVRIWLRSHDLQYQFHNYKSDGCDDKLVATLLKHFTYNELINKRGTTWRQLPENLKTELNEKTAKKLMTSQPSIIVRPIFKMDEQWSVGLNEELLSKKSSTKSEEGIDGSRSS